MGGEADAYVVVDGEAHATGDEATIAVRPCPSVALLEDHAMSKPSTVRVGMATVMAESMLPIYPAA